MRNLRRQLSIYAPVGDAQYIEDIREVVDPVQSRLIPAHVTLCREDELSDRDGIRDRIRSNPFKPVELTFGKPETFSSHGLLLPCIKGEDAFRRLREYLLGSKDIKDQKPHITLAHPRNPKFMGDGLAVASRLPDSIKMVFSTISLIEQEPARPWQVLERYDLRVE